jgi:hypothetical protein
MDNFDLRKYLAEGKLLKEELTWYIENENEDIRFQNDEYLREVEKKIKEIHPDISDKDLNKIIIMTGEQYSREEDFHGDSIPSSNFVNAAVEIYQTDVLGSEDDEDFDRWAPENLDGDFPKDSMFAGWTRAQYDAYHKDPDKYLKDKTNPRLKENKMDNFDLRKYLAEGKLYEEEKMYTLFTTNVEYDNGKTGYMYQLVDSEDGEENEIGFDQLYFVGKGDASDPRVFTGKDFKEFDQGSYQEEEVSAEEAMKIYKSLAEDNLSEMAYERDSVEDIVKRIKPILANHPQLKTLEDPDQYLIDFVTKRKKFLNKNEAPIDKDKFTYNVGTTPYDKYINLQFNKYIYSTLAEGKLLKEDSNSIVNLLMKNQREVAKKLNYMEYFPFDEVNIDLEGDASIVLQDEAGGLSFRYPEDVDSKFVGQNGDKPRPVTIGGVDLMYIGYNI